MTEERSSLVSGKVILFHRAHGSVISLSSGKTKSQVHYNSSVTYVCVIQKNEEQWAKSYVENNCIQLKDYMHLHIIITDSNYI